MAGHSSLSGFFAFSAGFDNSQRKYNIEPLCPIYQCFGFDKNPLVLLWLFLCKEKIDESGTEIQPDVSQLHLFIIFTDMLCSVLKFLAAFYFDLQYTKIECFTTKK